MKITRDYNITAMVMRLSEKMQEAIKAEDSFVTLDMLEAKDILDILCEVAKSETDNDTPRDDEEEENSEAHLDDFMDFVESMLKII